MPQERGNRLLIILLPIDERGAQYSVHSDDCPRRQFLVYSAALANQSEAEAGANPAWSRRCNQEFDFHLHHSIVSGKVESQEQGNISSACQSEDLPRIGL